MEGRKERPSIAYLQQRLTNDRNKKEYRSWQEQLASKENPDQLLSAHLQSTRPYFTLIPEHQYEPLVALDGEINQ